MTHIIHNFQSIAPNFTRKYFACGCGCGFDTVDTSLLFVLQLLRDEIELPVYLNSGSRCEDYNAKIGGASHSQHLYGKAADIHFGRQYPIPEAAILLDSFLPNLGGIGVYDHHLHLDVRASVARWPHSFWEKLS